MKRGLKIALVVIIVFVAVVAGGFFYLTKDLEAMNTLQVNDIDVSSLEDGTYKGEYNGGRWTNEVNVTVKDHRITGIDVVKDVVFSKPEVTEEIINRVLEKQSTQIDVVSGSTVTSKAYLKAIEDALVK
ncbi:MAG: FMN-binding protein [Mahellales bacterium]